MPWYENCIERMGRNCYSRGTRRTAEGGIDRRERNRNIPANRQVPRILSQGGTRLKVKTLITLLAVLLVIAPAVFSQSRETGAITGKAVDDQGSPLPGVTLTLTGTTLMGTRSQISDANGDFRFPALPPGVYNVRAELQGFATQLQENIRLTTTTTLALDFTLKPATVAEEVTVVAKAPTIDVKSTETASVTLSNEILRNIPYNQFTADIVNLAPGVNDNVAYGASASTGVAYTVDGVGVADPDGGSAWVFMDHNIVEEAKIMGIGVPAEYGNFTGVIFNLVTKSGGNNFSGHVEFNFQGAKDDGKFWMADNMADYIADFPNLTAASSALMDINAHLGGPIKKDKLWFYTGAQFYRTKNRPTGFAEDVDYKQPRWFGKLTAQATPTLNFSASLEIDNYIGKNRARGLHRLPRGHGDPGFARDRGQFQPDQDPEPEDLCRLQGRLFLGLLLPRPRNGDGHLFALRRRRELPARQRDLFLLRRPDALPGQCQPDALRRGLHPGLARLQVRRRGRAVRRPEPVRLRGHGRRARRPRQLPGLLRRTLPGLPVRGLRHEYPVHPRRGLRPGFLADLEAPEHQFRRAAQPELGPGQGRQRQPVHVLPARPPRRFHLRRPGRQIDHPEGPLRPVHRGHAGVLPRPAEPVFGLHRLHLLRVGRRGLVGIRPDRPREPVHDGSGHQAPLHVPDHGRAGTGALQGYVLRHHLHQPQVEQHHRTRRPQRELQHGRSHGPRAQQDLHDL